MTQEIDDVEKVFNDGLSLYKSTAKLLAESVKGNEGALKELTAALNEIVELKIEADCIERADQLLKIELDKCKDKENIDINSEFERALTECRKDGMVDREPYDGLRDNFKKYIKKLKNNYGVELAEVQSVRRDPWTQELIERPIFNSVCGHIYDQMSVEQFVTKKKNVRCPYMGCQEVIKEDKLTSVV